MKLYEIDKAILEFEFIYDEETGEILNAEELDDLKMARETKLENIGLYVKNLEAEAKAIKEEEAALAERRKRKEHKAENLKEYLAYALGGQKFETPRIAYSWRRSESIQIADNAQIPNEYLKVKTVTEPNKPMLKKAIKGGESFQGVTLVEKQNLQIK